MFQYLYFYGLLFTKEKKNQLRSYVPDAYGKTDSKITLLTPTWKIRGKTTWSLLYMYIQRNWKYIEENIYLTSCGS